MPRKEIHTDLDGQKIKLTNLDKIIYPSLRVSKAEIIQFYLNVAPYILPYIRHRPLTLIRYPDGIAKDSFYSKNKVTWTPEWINSIQIPDSNGKFKEYISADNQASMAWLGNMAALELHPMQVTESNIVQSDHFIFDLDPPEDQNDFEHLIDLTLRLKVFLESYDYVPFVKTSGGKGVHLYIPIQQRYSQKDMYAAVKVLGQQFIKENTDSTLHLNKDKRKGKVLIDILRNNYTHTCVAPYSLRGKENAPVSMPISWASLPTIKSSQSFTIKNVIAHLYEYGDAWTGFHGKQKPIHTHRNLQIPVSPLLFKYKEKRDFTATPEPIPQVSSTSKSRRFSIQLHNASNLHYDLRLEDNDVLLSWAIPKGLPSKKGVKRLAIQTEAHPLEYLHWEGVIPKGQYGAGEMWVFDNGHYLLNKKEKRKISFSLNGKGIKGEYLIYHLKDAQWLIEKKNDQSIDLSNLKNPMLAKAGKAIPSNTKHFFEIKWDGIRCVCIIEQGNVRLFSRNGNDITSQFPEIINDMGRIEAENAVLDGEIVYLEKSGQPNFSKVVGRIHLAKKESILKASKFSPASIYFFDLLHLDGLDTRPLKQTRRKAYLKTIISQSERIRYSDDFNDGKALFEAAKTHNLEGIMVKQKDAPYQSGTRTDHWLKIKVSINTTATVIGYTKGQGDRTGLIGALHLQEIKNNVAKYVGKVGTGFDSTLLKEITQRMLQLHEVDKPIKENIEEAHRTVWIEPIYQIDLRYTSLSSNGTYREPVFIRMYKK